MMKSKQQFLGYDCYFLTKSEFYNIGKFKMMICKNGSIAVFDVDEDLKKMLTNVYERLLKNFPHCCHSIPINMADNTLFFRADKCITFAQDEVGGVCRKQLPDPGTLFTGKVSIKVAGVKVKNSEASPIVKADQLLIIKHGGDNGEDQEEVACRLSLNDHDEDIF